MRDLLILLIVVYGLFHVFARPYVGIYLWTWISLMSPHRLTYGFALTFPFAQIIGITTLVGLVTGRQKKLNPWSAETMVLLLLILWISFTSLFAVNPEGAHEGLIKVLKIQVFIFLTILLISDKKKLDTFIWVVVLSIGYYGVKGGIFTIATGGNSRVWGPEGTFIGGNNEVALAMLMTVPLMRYLQLQATHKYVRLGLIAAMLLTAAAILGSQSRGAFLGIMAIGAFFWWKSPYKLGASVLVGVVATMVLAFMPQEWWDRMGTIKEYDEDDSAMGRINAWWVAFHMANDRLTGGGMEMFTAESFAKYAPNPYDVHDVHSIYFEMLGEQGWIGFALFMTLALLTWRKCANLTKQGREDPANKWQADLGPMLQVSLIGYFVSGAFLGMSYFDYYYDLVAMIVIAHKLTVTAPQEARLAPGDDNGRKPGRMPVPVG